MRIREPLFACLAMLALVLGVASCARGNRDGGRTVAQATARAAAPLQTQPTPSAATSTLQRRDVPPDGVASQLAFASAIVHNPCDPRRASKSPSVSVASPVEVLAQTRICPSGFDGDDSVDIEVARPDGSLVTVRSGIWISFPGDPLGTHRVTVREGDRVAEGRFEVVRATSPRTAVRPREGRAGGTFRLAMAGFVAGSTVPVHLYRVEGSRWVYRTTLEARVGRNGEGERRLDTATSDPRGTYCLTVAPVSCIGGAVRFTVA